MEFLNLVIIQIQFGLRFDNECLWRKKRSLLLVSRTLQHYFQMYVIAIRR